MCGIFGLLIQGESDLSPDTVRGVFDTLFLLSESRGKEAAGIGVSIGESTRIFKLPTRANILIRTPEYHNLLTRVETAKQKQYPVAIVGHSRIATNGPLSDNRNNQPIVGSSSLVIHNGVIINDRQIWKKYPQLKQRLTVDSEIISALYELHRKNGISPSLVIRSIFRELVGEASVAIMESHTPCICLATNTGSLYFVKKHGLIIFASERYILTKLIQTETALSEIPTNDISQIPAGTGAIIDLSRMQFEQFKLSSKIRTQFVPSTTSFVRPLEDVSPVVSFEVASDLRLNSISKLRKHYPNDDAIAKIRRCTRCIMPTTMPLIAFDSDGVCNFCRSYSKQKPLGLKALQSLVSLYRSKTGQKADCIVPLSGGRDSSYGLHFAKKILHLHPVAYTYDWGMVTDIARRNQSRMCAALGIEHIWVSADISKKRENIQKNIYAWLAKPDLGMVTLMMAGDKQAEYYAEDLKRKTGLKLTIYCRGNQLEDERFKFGYYGIFDGTPKGVIHNLSWEGKLKMLGYYGQQFIRNTKYINSSLLDSAWAYASAYLMPHDFTYLWHYIPWKEDEVIGTLTSQYGWETPTDTTSTWRIDDGTPPFYNYIYYHVQGFTENDGLRSNQIREGVISRKRALELVNNENKPRYESLAWYFDLLHLNGDNILSTIDSIPRLY